jgi:hypothetical protein
MLSLRDELERHNVTLLIATMPQTTFETAIGRYLFLQICGAAQLQRDLDSERMTAMTKSLFLDGRHRGGDPFGYRSARDERGVLRKVRPGERPKAHRLYLLQGVIRCENGHPMHGACRVSRRQAWRYYVCRKCRMASVWADDAERLVLEAIKTLTLPPKAIDEARAELARRLDVPDGDLVGTKRRRLETRLNRLTQSFGWGELSG